MKKTGLSPLLVAIVALIAVAPLFGASGAARPNILWIVSEDNSPFTVGAYGDPLARTPHLDRLAANGVVFDRVFAAAPVCAPSRASIITGMYASALGTQPMRSQVPLPSWLRYFPSYLRDAGYFTTNRAKTDYNAAVLPGTWDQNGEEAHWRNRARDQPFFSVFNFNSSHESRLHERLPLKTDPALVIIPPYLPDTPEVRADIAQYYDRVSQTDTEIGLLLAELDDAGLADNTIVFYFSDHGGVLPRSKRFLYESGTRVPLIIRFPPKYRHLAPGVPGSRKNELINLIDLAPTVLSLADVEAPTFLQGRAFAGTARKPAPPFTLMFRDRMDERYDLARAVTDGRWRYIRNYRPELPDMQHLAYLWNMASTAEWDLLHRTGGLNEIQAAPFNAKPAEQLFDSSSDPHNVHNLAADPAHRETLMRLRAANRAHLLAIRDTGFMPEAMIRQLAGDRSPVTICGRDDSYPLERLLNLIDALQLSEGASEDMLSAAANDPLAVVRYWAALAGVYGNPTLNAVSLLQDSDASVRLAAAFSVVRQGKPDAAWPVFRDALAPSQPAELRLAALNFLTLTTSWPDSFRPLIAAPQQADTRMETYVARAAEHLLREQAR